jgi:hypothetical protein
MCSVYVSSSPCSAPSRYTASSPTLSTAAIACIMQWTFALSIHETNTRATLLMLAQTTVPSRRRTAGQQHERLVGEVARPEITNSKQLTTNFSRSSAPAHFTAVVVSQPISLRRSDRNPLARNFPLPVSGSILLDAPVVVGVYPAMRLRSQSSPVL